MKSIHDLLQMLQAVCLGLLRRARLGEDLAVSHGIHRDLARGAGIGKDAAEKAPKVLDAVRVQPSGKASQELRELVSPDFAERRL
jgi:hypothetical protein